jgi:hypothetical protein
MGPRRPDAAGAAAVRGLPAGTDERMPNLRDLDAIAQAVSRVNAKFVIVDP